MSDIQYYQAIQSFTPDYSKSNNQLPFQVGDMISVKTLHLSKITNGWILGRNARTLDYGWYPLSFLKKIEKEVSTNAKSSPAIASMTCPLCSKEFTYSVFLNNHLKKKVCQERKKRDSERHRRCRAAKSENKSKSIEEKACSLLASLSQSDKESVENAAKSWNFEGGCLLEGQGSIFNSALETLRENMPDAGDIALVIRKLGKPDEKIHRFKNHDSLFKLDMKVRGVIFHATKKKCLEPVYDENSRVTCSPKEACRKMELMYKRLGFADAKERALKGLEESKRRKGITE